MNSNSSPANQAPSEPGTYIYWATTTDKTLALRGDAETMLSGAFVVDLPGTKPDDLIFVLSMWTKDPAAGLQGTIVSINGKSWPYTEHLTYKIGATTHWRVINATESDHAMHLTAFVSLWMERVTGSVTRAIRRNTDAGRLLSTLTPDMCSR